jgi:hypothetical protein
MKLSIVLLVFIFSACSENPMLGTKKPVDLISTDKMVGILIDLNLIEADLQMKYAHISFYGETMKKSGDLILKKHGFTRKQFEESFDYYASRQEDMIALNNQILDSLNVAAAKFSNNHSIPANSIQVEESALKKTMH